MSTRSQSGWMALQLAVACIATATAIGASIWSTLSSDGVRIEQLEQSIDSLEADIQQLRIKVDHWQSDTYSPPRFPGRIGNSTTP